MWTEGSREVHLGLETVLALCVGPIEAGEDVDWGLTLVVTVASGCVNSSGHGVGLGALTGS